MRGSSFIIGICFSSALPWGFPFHSWSFLVVRWFTNRHLINESELPLMLQNSVSIQSLAYCSPKSFFFFFLCTGIFVDFTPSAYLCSAKETAYADARLVVLSSILKCSIAQGVLSANPLQCELLLIHSLIQ